MAKVVRPGNARKASFEISRHRNGFTHPLPSHQAPMTKSANHRLDSLPRLGPWLKHGYKSSSSKYRYVPVILEWSADLGRVPRGAWQNNGARYACWQRDACRQIGGTIDLLKVMLVQMMSLPLAVFRVFAEAFTCKNILPSPISCRTRRFTTKRIG